MTLVEVQTSGDQRSDAPLVQIGGEGIFTKEIQRSLLTGAVDVAIHSLKDLPTAPVEGLVLAAVPPRGSVQDVLVSRDRRRFDDLPAGSRVGTGSLRRRAQMLHRRRDLQVIDIRGNVDTRLRKLADGQVDALALAQAGLERLGLRGAVTESLSVEWMLPAVGQGALGLECRAADRETMECVKQLDHPATHQAVTAERSLLAAVGGGCLLPLGVAAEVNGNTLRLRAVVLDSEGKQRIEDEVTGALSLAETLGRGLADRLLNHGARQLLGI